MIRADSSTKIGIGHIMRDLVLAGQYKNANIIFATMNLRGNINHKITEAGYEVVILNTNQPLELSKVLKKYQIDLLVFDHYQIDYKFEMKIKNTVNVKILSLDDTYEKHHCDIILNHNMSANTEKYTGLVPNNCEIRCGSQYTLIRDEFIVERGKIRKKETGNTIIFLAMGGSDYNNITLDILNVLKFFDKININLTVTDSNPNLASLKEFVKNNTWVNIHINSNKLAQLMNESDFAIVSPSVILHEVIYMQLPFIAIKTASNQSDIFNYLKFKNNMIMDTLIIDKLKKYIKLQIRKANL